MKKNRFQGLFLIFFMVGICICLCEGVFCEEILRFTEKEGQIQFTLYATLHSPEGIVDQFSGSVFWEKGRGFSSTTGYLIIPVENLNTKNKARDRKMSQYCLEISDYPLITFILDSVGTLPVSLNQNTTYSTLLYGKMNIKKVTQKIHIPLKLSLSSHSIHLQGTYRLNWKEYNVSDPSMFFLKLNPSMKIDWDLRIPVGK